MRALISLGLMTTAWMMSGCLGTDSSLVGPSSGTDDGANLILLRSDLRIVEPRAGAALTAGEPYLVIARQELRDGPPQGRAQLQYRAEGGDWTSACPAFPWERRLSEFVAEAAGCKGDGEIRLIVFDDRPEDPFLVSAAVRVRAVQRQLVEIAAK